MESQRGRRRPALAQRGRPACAALARGAGGGRRGALLAREATCAFPAPRPADGDIPQRSDRAPSPRRGAPLDAAGREREGATPPCNRRAAEVGLREAGETDPRGTRTDDEKIGRTAYGGRAVFLSHCCITAGGNSGGEPVIDVLARDDV